MYTLRTALRMGNAKTTIQSKSRSMCRLIDIRPSHSLHHSKLFVHSALDIQQILDILPKFLILQTPQYCFHLLEEKLSFADKLARDLTGDHTIAVRRRRQHSSDIPGLVSLCCSTVSGVKGPYRKPRRSSWRRFPFCKPRRLPNAPTIHCRVAYDTRIPGVSPTKLHRVST